MQLAAMHNEFTHRETTMLDLVKSAVTKLKVRLFQTFPCGRNDCVLLLQCTLKPNCHGFFLTRANNCLQDAKYPHAKSEEFQAVVDAVVESAKFELQESWWKAQPKKLVQFEKDVKEGKKTMADYNASAMKTGGGDMCYLFNICRHANAKILDQVVELGEKWERGDLATSRAKGINLVGKKNVTKSARAVKKTGTFNIQALYKMLQGLHKHDQVELLEAAIHDVRSWDETRKVCLVATLFCSIWLADGPPGCQAPRSLCFTFGCIKRLAAGCLVAGLSVFLE